LARAVVDDLFDSGGYIWSALAATVLVEALLQRGGDADLKDARAAIDCLAVVPTTTSHAPLGTLTCVPARLAVGSR
jgi:adenylate cyclase